MISFIKYSQAPTPDLNDVTSAQGQATPFLYIGNQGGFTSSDYDIFENGNLKHLKISVSDYSTNPILRIDTLDLYHGADHTVSDLFNTPLIFDKDKGSAQFGAPLQGTSVRFQRVHFRALSQQYTGTVDEYFAHFLVSGPVRIANSEIGPSYVDFDTCSHLTSPDVALDEEDEQDDNKSIAESWGQPEINEERLIIGDSLAGQVNKFHQYSNTESDCFDTGESCEYWNTISGSVKLYAFVRSGEGIKRGFASKITLGRLAKFVCDRALFDQWAGLRGAFCHTDTENCVFNACVGENVDLCVVSGLKDDTTTLCSSDSSDSSDSTVCTVPFLLFSTDDQRFCNV